MLPAGSWIAITRLEVEERILKIIFGCVLALTMLMSGAAHAWSDKTFMDKGTPLRVKPNEKSKVIVMIPDGQVVNGATKSIDRDCSYETKFDIFCKIVWRGKTGYVLIDDLLELGDDDLDF